MQGIQSSDTHRERLKRGLCFSYINDLACWVPTTSCFRYKIVSNRLVNNVHNLLTTNGPSTPALETVAPNHWWDFVSICSFRSLNWLPIMENRFCYNNWWNRNKCGFKWICTKLPGINWIAEMSEWMSECRNVNVS